MQRIKADNDLYGVKLKLKLTFVNRSKGSVLLFRGFSVSHLWISSNTADALAKKFEVSNAITDVSDRVENAGMRIDSDFKELQKNESFETEWETTIFVKYEPSSNIPGSVSKGRHVLQLELSNPITKGVVVNPIKKGDRKEDVLAQRLVSEPMEFLVE